MEKQLEVLIIMLGLNVAAQLLVAFTNRHKNEVERRMTRMEHDIYDHDGDMRKNRHNMGNNVNDLALKVQKIYDKVFPHHDR